MTSARFAAVSNNSRKRTLPRSGDGFEDEFDFFADGPFVLEDVARVAFAFFEALQHAVDGVEQLENVKRPVFGRGRGGCKFQFSRQTRKNIFLLGFAHLQLRGGVLEFLYRRAGGSIPSAGLRLRPRPRPRPADPPAEVRALDIHERRGHHEKFAGDLEIELAHQVNVRDELRGELGEVDLVNVHLLLLDEIKEQVERAFKTSN